jgi:SAM-dependent methyltransferase
MDIQKQITAFYEDLLKTHGTSVESLAMPTQAAQLRNFECVTKAFAHETQPFTVYEVGCGFGDMADYLAEHYPLARYAGSDISSEMIKSALELRPRLDVECRDVIANPPEPADYVVLCGVFNCKLDASDEAWQEFVFTMLRAMWGFARKGISANFHTGYVDWQKPADYHQDPLKIFDFAKRELGRYVDLRHAYYPWEFALHVYREPVRLR